MEEAGKVFARKADCAVCSRGFGAQAVAEAHALAHAGWVACTECGETMPVDEFKIHRRRRHLRRGYECHCGAAFYTQRKLEGHTRDIHTGPFYRCGRCMKVFRDWKTFTTHIQTTRGRCTLVNPLYPKDPDPDPEPESESESESRSVAEASATSTMQSRQQPVRETSSTSDDDGDWPDAQEHRLSE